MPYGKRAEMAVDQTNIRLLSKHHGLGIDQLWLLGILAGFGGIVSLTPVLPAFWLVGYEAKRRSGSWRIAALVTTPACIITINNLIVRPQNWSWLPFMAFFTLLSRFADRP